MGFTDCQQGNIKSRNRGMRGESMKTNADLQLPDCFSL